MAYAKTTVSVPRSQEQVRAILRAAGADRIVFGEVLTGEKKSAGIEFLHAGVMVRVLCPIKADETRDREFDQETRRVWRVLHWSIKARMESVDEGLETFEQAFLPHIVDPASGMTLWQMIQPQIEAGALAVEGGVGFDLSFTRAIERGS